MISHSTLMVDCSRRNTRIYSLTHFNVDCSTIKINYLAIMVETYNIDRDISKFLVDNNKRMRAKKRVLHYK
jgi:hypothetical protein